MIQKYGYYYFISNMWMSFIFFISYILNVNVHLIVKIYITVFVLVTFIYFIKKPPKFIITLKGLKNDFRLEYRKSDRNREGDRI